MSDSTYILVHGAWHGAWCWRDVGEELSRRGERWIAVDLPSSTPGAHPNTYLADDAREVIGTSNAHESVVLVGHSYGGAVVVEAADRLANLERLVLITALVPMLDQSTNEASQEVDIRTPLDDAIEVDGDYLRLDKERAQVALYQDCEKNLAEWASAQLTKQTIASLRSPRSSFGIEARSRYILCTNDNALDPQLQYVMAQRCDEVVTLESGHSPFFSRVNTLCDLILSET
jgi:pimeloyl-ACP methyl ester carboxylesterase